MRLNKNFIQDVFANNLKPIFEHIESIKIANTQLNQFDLKLERISFKVVSEKKGSALATELTFDDEDQVVQLDIQDLTLRGSAMIKGSGIKNSERVTIEAPLDIAVIQLKIGQETTLTGQKMPRLYVKNVTFLPSSNLKISTFGDLPLYKTHEFEKAVEQWVHETVKLRANEFGIRLQQAEQQLISQFDYKGQLQNDQKLKESLAEEFVLKDDFLYVQFKKTFQGVEVEKFQTPLRIHQPSFVNLHNDIQLLIDENYINEWFLKIQEDESQVVSLTYILKSLLPKKGASGKTASIALKALMSVKVWKTWFPSLGQEFSSTKALDLRCSMSQSMIKGQLSEIHITQVEFHQDNKLSFRSYGGCGIYVYKGLFAPNEAIKKVDQGADDEDFGDDEVSPKKREKVDSWDNYRSFYFSSKGDLKFDFSEHLKKDLSLLQAKVVDFNLDVTELRIFRNDQEIKGEDDNLNLRIKQVQNLILNYGLNGIFGNLAQFIKLPISPYPQMETCLGLTGKSAYMEFQEGYATIGYDYKTKTSTSNCLFNNQKK